MFQTAPSDAETTFQLQLPWLSINPNHRTYLEHRVVNSSWLMPWKMCQKNVSNIEKKQSNPSNESTSSYLHLTLILISFWILVVKIITQTKKTLRDERCNFFPHRLTWLWCETKQKNKWLSRLKARASGSSKDSPTPAPRDQALLHLSNKVAEVFQRKCVPKSRRFFL